MADVSGESGTGGPSGGGEQGPSGGVDQPVGDICAFCLDPIDDSTACYSTACPLHISHKNCIIPWIKNSRTCATCRAPVTKLKMKSGKVVPLPPLTIEVVPQDQPPLSEEAYAAGVGLDSDSDSSDEDFISPEEREQRRVARSARRTMRYIRDNVATDHIIRNLFTIRTEDIRSPLSISRTRRAAARTRSNVYQLSSRPSRSGRSADMQEIEARYEEEERRGERRRAPSVTRVILGSDDEIHTVEEPQEERRRPRRVADEEVTRVRLTASESSSEESESDEDEEESEEGSEEDSTSSLSDSAIHDDEDQPSTSTMNPIVRRRKSKRKTGAKKKRTTTTSGGVKKRKSKRKGTKRSSKKRRERRPVAEERSEQRHRLRQVIPSLSLNGAGLEPVDDEMTPMEVFSADSPSSRPPPPATAASDPTDLLGSILTNQVVALTPGRYLLQRNGRFQPNERFNRHLDRLESRGALPVSRDEVQPATRSSTTIDRPSLTASRPTDPTRRFDFFGGESSSPSSCPRPDDNLSVTAARARSLRESDASRQELEGLRRRVYGDPSLSSLLPRYSPPSLLSNISRPPTERPNETPGTGSRGLTQSSRTDTVSREAGHAAQDALNPSSSAFTRPRLTSRDHLRDNRQQELQDLRRQVYGDPSLATLSTYRYPTVTVADPSTTVSSLIAPNISVSSSTDHSSASRPLTGRPNQPSGSGSQSSTRESRRDDVSREDTSRRVPQHSVSTIREVPLVSPFTRSTPLPPLVPSVSVVAPPSSSTSESRQRSEAHQRRNEIDRIKRERAAQIRRATTAILDNPHRKRKITDEQRRAIMKRCHEQFFDRLLFDESRTKQFARNAFDDVINEMMME